MGKVLEQRGEVNIGMRNRKKSLFSCVPSDLNEGNFKLAILIPFVPILYHYREYSSIRV